MTRRTRVTLAVAALLAATAPADADAQVSSDTSVIAAAARRGWFVGGALGVPGARGELAPELFTLGLQVSQFGLRRPGLDFALGTAPRVIEFGGVGARAGVTVPLPVSRSAVLMPVVGVSAIAALSDGAATGFHGGASLVFGDLSQAVPRVTLTGHRFEDAIELVWLLEFGFARLFPSAR